MIDNGKNNIYREWGVTRFFYVVVGGDRVLCYGALQRRWGGLKNDKIGVTEQVNDPLTHSHTRT